MGYAVRLRDGAMVGRHVGDLRGLRVPDGEDMETFDDREAFDARVAELRAQRTPEPDVDGLLVAARDLLGKVKAREVARAYPDLTQALDRGNWPVVREAVDDALADGVVTEAQHADLVALLDTYHIPGGSA